MVKTVWECKPTAFAIYTFNLKLAYSISWILKFFFQATICDSFCEVWYNMYVYDDVFGVVCNRQAWWCITSTAISCIRPSCLLPIWINKYYKQYKDW